jgi:ABC-type glycerol-3-phosphate transport system substrate-binding protein
VKTIPRLRLALPLFVAGYVFAVYWVFTKSTPLVDERDVTIRIAHWQIELGPPDGIDAVIKRYEELNPRVRVKQVMVPGPVYRQWMRANFSGDTAPDIVEYGAWLDGLADLPVRYFDPMTEDLLEPNPYNRGTGLEGLPWLKTFADELSEQRINSPEPGQYYAVTLSRGSQRLFCNRDLLREITGTEEPPADFAAMRELFAQAQAYGAARGRPVYPFAGSRDNVYWLMAFYMRGATNRVAQRVDRDGFLALYPRQTMWAFLNGEWSYQEPDLQAGLALLGELAEQIKPGYMQFVRDEAVRQFLNGEALFLFAGTWEATSLRRLAPFPMDTLRPPQPTTDDPVVGRAMLGRFSDGNNVTGFGFYLNKRTPYRAEAVDFLRFLTSYEGIKLFTDHSGWAPSIRDVPMAPEVESLLSPDDGFAFGGPNITVGGATRAVFERNLHLLTGPGGSVAKFAEALDQQMQGPVRDALATEGRAARWAMLPQDTRVVALGQLVEGHPDDEAVALRRSRLEAAQYLSEARALLIQQQLQRLGAR